MFSNCEIYTATQQVVADEFDKLINFINNGVVIVRSDRYPERLESMIQNAVTFKREGKYIEAVLIYFELFYKDRVVYSSMLYFLYKVVACAGDFFDAIRILILAENIIDAQVGLDSGIMPFAQTTHRRELLMALLEFQNGDIAPLNKYLKNISGNQNYQLSITENSINNEIEKILTLSRKYLTR